MVQFKGSNTYVEFFSAFCVVRFRDFFKDPPVWEPKRGVRCILRTFSPRLHQKIVGPSVALFVVHVAGTFTQISGMEVGKGMEGQGIKCKCLLSVLLGCKRAV